jgi:hypothetical protein
VGIHQMGAQPGNLDAAGQGARPLLGLPQIR